MKLKVNSGKVQFIMTAGKDFVRTEMNEDAANKIIKEGKTSTSSLFEGFPLCVDDTYFFAACAEKTTKGQGYELQ